MSSRKGFTLIELLIVVVIIGILAAIAIPKFANTKEKAIIAGMKSDLKNLATAQEAYFSDNQTYTTDLGDLNFVASGGNSVTVTAADGGGWEAEATHSATSQTCTIAVGSRVGPGEPDGVPVCN